MKIVLFVLLSISMYSSSVYSFEQGCFGLVSDVKDCRDKAEQGNSKAQYYLGKSYDHGEGVPVDYNEAAKWYRKSAEQGDPDGQSGLGVLYANGQGVPGDYSKALEWVNKSVAQGSANGQFSLGMMHRWGIGIPEDFKEALLWFKKSAEQGNAKAQYTLGVIYENGDVVHKDDKEAAKWYEKSAEQGSAEAQYALAWMLERSIGRERPTILWYFKAAEQGNAEAQLRLGSLYLEEYDNRIKSDERAEKGISCGRRCPVSIFEDWSGDNQENLKDAVYWLVKSSEQGNAQAKSILVRWKGLLKKRTEKRIINQYKEYLTKVEFCDSEYTPIFKYTLMTKVNDMLLPALKKDYHITINNESLDRLFAVAKEGLDSSRMWNGMRRQSDDAVEYFCEEQNRMHIEFKQWYENQCIQGRKNGVVLDHRCVEEFANVTKGDKIP